jgi:hypothetical protein
MNLKKYEEWKEQGYGDAEWGYPLLDHAWSRFHWLNGKHPRKYQTAYRIGMLDAYHDGNAKKPWWIK